MEIVKCSQCLWAVLFTLGSIWNPLGRQDLWIIIMEMNDYGIFCMECSMMVLADDPPPLPPPPTLPLQFLCFLFVLLIPFNVVWIWRKPNFSELSAAECLTVTTVCMLAVLKRSTQAGFLSCYCACRQTVFNVLNYLPAYLQYLPPVCLCQNLVLPLLPLPYTPPETPWWGNTDKASQIMSSTRRW